jgi:NTE family protein
VTAFVLAGGGSLGAVQVGMLRALTNFGLAPDFVVGSSVGSINAAYFAGQPTSVGVAQLESIWRKLRRREVFPVTALSGALGLVGWRSHLVSPAPLAGLLARHLPFQRLELARVPCHIVATDVLSGLEVRLSQGDAVSILLASTAIPALFPAVTWNGQHLMDGGVANHTPISTAVALGATRIVVLPTGFPCAIERPPRGPIAMALHALNMLIARQLALDIERFSAVAQVIVVPPLCPLMTSSYDFSQGGGLIDRAAGATREWLAAGGLSSTGIPGALRAHHH